MSETAQTLPFVPEPLEALKVRYPEAVKETYIAEGVARGLIPPPSAKREHVFDCEDGMRLIISREMFPSGHIGIHLSASFTAIDSPGVLALQEQMKRGQQGLIAYLAAMTTRYGEIAGVERQTYEFLGMSDLQIPHLVKWEHIPPMPSKSVM